MSKDTVSRTLVVAFVVCVFCSVIVSAAAVSLRPAQKINKELDRKRNILAAAGLLREGADVNRLFSNIQTRVVDLDTGQYADSIDVQTYDQRRAAGDPGLSRPLSTEEDTAKISRRERYALVYLVMDKSRPNQFSKIILPMHGYGLWSTMYGFLAVHRDLNTVAGLGFYEHGETPGLGGEIDNPRWKKIWAGKHIFSGAVGEDVGLSVLKGFVDSSKPGSEYLVDGLAGATLTARGVDQLIKFWLGDLGFGPFLSNLEAGGV